MPDLAPQHRSLLGRATIGDQLRRHARTQPDRVAIVSYTPDGERSETTYAALNDRANRYAHLFANRGVGRGGRVASMARNSVEVVAAYYGALIVYTSGTEVTPKGVLIPHRNYLASTAPARGWGLHTGPADTWLFVMPFHTIAGLGSMTSLTLMGATLVLPAIADAQQAVDIIGRERVTVIAQTPTFYLALTEQPGFGPATVGQVRRCLTYGGQFPPRVIEAWNAATWRSGWSTRTTTTPRWAS